MTAEQLKAYANRVLAANSVKSTAGALATEVLEFLSDLETLGMEMDEDVSLDDSVGQDEDQSEEWMPSRAPITGDVGGLTQEQMYVFDFVNRFSMAKAGAQVNGNVARQLVTKGLIERMPRGTGHRGGRGAIWYQMTEKGRLLAEQLFVRTVESDIAEDR